MAAVREAICVPKRPHRASVVRTDKESSTAGAVRAVHVPARERAGLDGASEWERVLRKGWEAVGADCAGEGVGESDG